jgi:hypothetical protein
MRIALAGKFNQKRLLCDNYECLMKSTRGNISTDVSLPKGLIDDILPFCVDELIA